MWLLELVDILSNIMVDSVSTHLPMMSHTLTLTPHVLNLLCTWCSVPVDCQVSIAAYNLL